MLAANSAPGEPYFDEVLTFVAPGPSMYEYIVACFADRHADDYPPAFYFGLVADLDISYGTSAVSYTAAAGGFPLGDLNWYPDKKADWEAWVATGIKEDLGASVRAEFSLEQNYPNPFNPTTQIEFSIKKSGMVTLKVYNMLGQVVATVVNENLTAGSYKANFDGANLASGVYAYKLIANDYSAIKKMVLIK